MNNNVYTVYYEKIPLGDKDGDYLAQCVNNSEISAYVTKDGDPKKEIKEVFEEYNKLFPHASDLKASGKKIVFELTTK